MDDEILNPSTPRATSPDSEESGNDNQRFYQNNQPSTPILERRRSVRLRNSSIIFTDTLEHFSRFRSVNDLSESVKGVSSPLPYTDFFWNT